MKIYKIKLKPQSSQITPWQSDTVFGSLCWILAQTEGAERLKSFLDLYEKGEYPLVISDGFPGDLLPKPLALNASLLEEEKAKKIDFVNLEEFNEILNNKNVDVVPKGTFSREIGVMHNEISRITNTVVDGGLFEVTECYWEETFITLYLGIDDSWKEQILNLFEILSQRGFGKRTSVGKGQFTIEDFSEFQYFEISENSNAFVTLSNYVPRKTDPTEGLYKTFVKYGKLGQSYALSDNPFKKPLLMIKPGAVFWTERPQYAYGRLVHNVSYDFPEVLHCGCTLAIPAYINKPSIY